MAEINSSSAGRLFMCVLSLRRGTLVVAISVRREVCCQLHPRPLPVTGGVMAFDMADAGSLLAARKPANR